MTAGVLLLLAAAGLVAAIVAGPRFPRVWLALTLAGLAASSAAGIFVLTGGADWEWRGSFSLGGEVPHLRLDGLSALFLVLVGVVGGTGAVYAREYGSDGERTRSAPRGRAFWSAILLSFLGVLLSSNGLHFLIAWELVTVCAYFLITLDRKQREVRAAGWLYLAASHASTVLLFAFFGSLAARSGSWDLGPMRDQVTLAPLFWLALLGFGVKAGAFPLHVWLPSAHANAPSHVSALLSGVAIKLGVYGIVRFSGWLPTPPAAGATVIAVGALGAVLGIAFGFAQNDIKRLLAYCSVENVGIILIAVGAALLGAAHGDAPWGRLALAGGLLHVWNHGLFKALLFLGAGTVVHATGTREMSRLGGLWRTMPWTAGLFALGAVAISGLPPLNGFVSEWLIYLGLFEAAIERGPAAWAAAPAAIALALAGALALASFIKLSAMVFLGAPRTQAAREAHDGGRAMRGSMLVLAVGCVAIGLAPAWFWPAIARATGAWNPAWVAHGAVPPLATLGPLHVALTALALAAAGWSWRRVRRSGLVRAPTWDCGFAAPTARMQYSGGSFAGIITDWFSWILRPERRSRRARGAFPEGASRVDRIPDIVLEQVIRPVGALVMRVSAAVRTLQHGRLQLYILYLFAGLAALAALVISESAR